MDEEHFWGIIESSRKLAGRDGELQAQIVERQLDELETPDVVGFHEIFWRQMASSYDWTLWAAASLINGGCSDDGFEYFRAWLVGQGRVIFSKSLGDPDSLSEYVDEIELENEDLLHAAANVYHRRTGTYDMSADLEPYGAVRGNQVRDADLERVLPKLYAKYGTGTKYILRGLYSILLWCWRRFLRLIRIP